MRLNDQLDAAEVRRRPVRCTAEQLGQREHSGCDVSHPRILGQEFGRVTAPNREAGGFQADDRRPRRDVGMQDVQGGAQLSPSAVELTGADPSQAAAGWSFHEVRRVTSRGEDRDGRGDGVSGEAIGKRVDPNNRWGT